MRISSINIYSPCFSADRNRDYYTGLSKNMAYALRHHPKECNLSPDEYGFVPVEGLLEYLNATGKWGEVTQKDLENTIKNSEKKRFEISDDKIRAYYGHSYADKVIKIPSEPPEYLYHGTTHKAADKIMVEGLNSQQRQYVHLSSTVQSAVDVGKRRDYNPVLLVIDAKRAHNDGCKFYFGNDDIWLSDNIPPEYIKRLNKKEDV